MILTALLAAFSVYLFSYVVQETLYEKKKIQKRIQKITLGSYDLLQKAALEKGYTPLYRVKKSTAFNLKRLRLFSMMGLILGLLFASQASSPITSLIVLIPAMIPIFVTFSVAAAKTYRETRIKNELPGAMDLMIICLQAGLGINAAFERVANEMEGSPLGFEFQQMVNETGSGLPLEEALRSFSSRTNMTEVSNIVGPIIQANKTGSSIVETFKIQAASLREKLQLQQKEKMMKIPVLVLLPMVLFILPVIFLIVLGPVAVQMSKGNFL